MWNFCVHNIIHTTINRLPNIALKIKFFWSHPYLFSVHLDTAYFAENWKPKTYYWKHYSKIFFIDINYYSPIFLTWLVPMQGKQMQTQMLYTNRPLVCVFAFCWKLAGPVHCSRDLQVLFSAKTTLKLSPTILFTHLKIILLQCFHFSAINDIQTKPYLVHFNLLANVTTNMPSPAA